MSDIGATPAGTTRYEFTAPQNATVTHLAVTMRFVGFANVILGAAVGASAVRVWTATPRGTVILAVLAILIIVIGAYLIAAARHFARIATTTGGDLDNLMTALAELAKAYDVQRWIFVAAVLVVLLALAMTVSVG